MGDLNSIFQEFAKAFLGKVKGESDILIPNKLERGKLDFSLDSLHLVDAYLEAIRELGDNVDNACLNNSILWGGAYIGEVIRQNADRTYTWIDYNDYTPAQPKLKNMLGERTLATCAFLCADSDIMTMPINKVVRFIYEGPDNNTHYYASCECKRT